MFFFSVLEAFVQAMIGAFATYPQLFLRNLGYSQSVTGVILALGQGASIIIPIFVAMISDKYSCDKLCILVCCSLSMLLRLPMLNRMSLVFLVVLFFLAEGLYSCTNPLVDGFINKSLKADTKKYSVIRSVGTFGYVIALFSFAFFKWPVETDNSSIILCQGILTIVTLLVVAIQPDKTIFRSTPEKKSEKIFDPKWFSSEFYLFFVFVFISRISMSAIDRLLPSYITEELNQGSSFTALIALGGFAEFFMLAFGQKLRLKSVDFMLISSMGIILRLIIYSLTSNVVVFAFAQLLHALCFGANHIACTRFITEKVSKEHYSTAMSLYWAVFTNLPIMIGTFVGGFIIDNMGYKNLFLMYSIFPAVSAFLTIKNKRRLG